MTFAPAITQEELRALIWHAKKRQYPTYDALTIALERAKLIQWSASSYDLTVDGKAIMRAAA